MNKKITNLACMLALSVLSVCLTLTSCSKDNDLEKPGQTTPTAVSFSSSVSAPGETTMLTEGTHVGISINGKASLFVTGKNGILTPAEPLFWSNDETVEVKAWQNIQVSSNHLDYPTAWQVNADQSKGYETSTFLFAQREVNPQSDDHKLNFIYQTSTIEVQVLSKTGISNISLGDKDSFKLSANWKDGEWSADQGQTSSIKPYKVSEVEGSTVFRATVIPQNVTDRPFISLTFEDGRTETYTPKKEEGDLKAGHLHTFKISVAAPIPAPVLSADKYQIKNNGETATFKVMQNGKDVTGEAIFTKDGQPYTGSTFSSNATGTFEFVATVAGKASNPITIAVVEAPKPEPVVPVLKASVTSIIADGKSAVQFTATPTEAVITCEELADFKGTVFTTTTAGTYHFKATLNEQSSNTVTIIAAPESVPVLSADKYEIKNDGEIATLKVMLDKTDVTKKATFTKDGKPFSGYSFSSETTGEYLFVATVEGKTSNAITITVVEAPKPEPIIPVLNADAATIVADGQSSVTFSVTPETAVITCQERPDFTGHVFTTTQAGTYHFKATYDGHESNVVTITATEPEKPDLDVEVSVTTPSNNGAWENQGTDNGTIII